MQQNELSERIMRTFSCGSLCRTEKQAGSVSVPPLKVVRRKISNAVFKTRLASGNIQGLTSNQRSSIFNKMFNHLLKLKFRLVRTKLAHIIVMNA